MTAVQSFSAPTACVVRAVPASFARALRTGPDAPDVERARVEHSSYVMALASCGVSLILVAADEACPDACFVEDGAVILKRRALITRPGAASRQPETPALSAALSDRFELCEMAAPATLDGGDVLRVGERLFVGLSERTSKAGAAVLAGLAAEEGLEVVRVPVAGGLHLKSLCSLAAADLLVHAPWLDVAPFAAAGLHCVAVPEAHGANVLALGDRVLVSAAAPRTADLLEARGLAVVRVPVHEFHRADGALTCLSIRIPPRDGWVT